MTHQHRFTVFHLFAGSGLGARGAQLARPTAGRSSATFRTLGGVDVDPSACRDFESLTGVPATRLDLAERWAYEAIHGRPPPPDWHEATPDDIRRAAGGKCPDVVLTSPPCVGFSGLVGGQRAGADKYQGLNSLVVRGLFLTLEAFQDDPPSFILLENVPLIQRRGSDLLDTVESMLGAYGYAVARTVHDCGEIGGLAQRRERFLLVARHRVKVPAHLHEPPKRRHRGVGEVLAELPIPGGPEGGPMHELPRLELLTLLRLACVQPGKDWRCLSRLPFDGVRIEPAADHHGGVLGVVPWTAPSGTVTGSAAVQRGAFSVQDIRALRQDDGGRPMNNVFRVVPFSGPAGAVTSGGTPTAGGQAVADARLLAPSGEVFANLGRVEDWDAPTHAVTGATRPLGGALSVADLRAQTTWAGRGKYRVTGPEEPAGAVIGESATGNGAFAVADGRVATSQLQYPKSEVGARYTTHGVVASDAPAGAVTGRAEVGAGAFAWADGRVLADLHMGQHAGKLRVEGWQDPAHAVTTSDRVGSGALSVADLRFTAKQEDGPFKTGGHLGVRPWEDPSYAVVGNAKIDRGPWAVQDVRALALTDRPWPVPILLSPWGTGWHRPFTTLELGVLQGLPARLEDGGWLKLDGGAHTRWRKHIGNGIPVHAAQAIFETIGRTLILAVEGRSFVLSSDPVWVRPESPRFDALTFALTLDL